MIAQLSGKIVSIGLDQAVIEVGGVGYLFFTTANTLATFQLEQSVTIYTHLVVKEDSLTLYGFESAQTVKVFSTLIGVSGVGPKTALAALSVFSTDQLRSVFANRDEAALIKIPGVGKKSAQRLLIEVGEKLGLPTEPVDLGKPTSLDQKSKEVVQALEQLGWKTKMAETAVSEAYAEHPQTSVPELLRSALQRLGKAHG